MESIKITSEDTIYPSDHKCIISGKKLSGGSIRLSIGALLLDESGSSIPCDNLEGFCSLTFRRNVIGEDGYVSSTKAVDFELVQPVGGGQFTLLFAGVDELREFFNQICNHMEEEIMKEESAK